MPEVGPSRYATQIGWRHVPHLTEKAKDELRRGTPPHLRRAREEGWPATGRGRIFPLDIEEIQVRPFKLPDIWPRVYGLDVGWRRTAALWCAWDRDADIVYAYSEYYVGGKPPALHARAIQARGDWIPGVIDPASQNRTQRDGENLIDGFRDAGLDVMPADNALESSLLMLNDRMTTGRFRCFSTLMHFAFEFNLYHRDEKGRVVAKNNHLLDALRYVENTGLNLAKTKRDADRASAAGDWTEWGVRDRSAGY